MILRLSDLLRNLDINENREIEIYDALGNSIITTLYTAHRDLSNINKNLNKIEVLKYKIDNSEIGIHIKIK